MASAKVAGMAQVTPASAMTMWFIDVARYHTIIVWAATPEDACRHAVSYGYEVLRVIAASQAMHEGPR